MRTNSYRLERTATCQSPAGWRQRPAWAQNAIEPEQVIWTGQAHTRHTEGRQPDAFSSPLGGPTVSGGDVPLAHHFSDELRTQLAHHAVPSRDETGTVQVADQQLCHPSLAGKRMR